MFKSTLSLKLVIFSIIFLIGVGISYYFILGKSTDRTFRDQSLRRQLTIARAQSSNIVSFFSVFGDSIAILAQSPSVKRRDFVTEDYLDTFVEQWRDSGLIDGVALADEEGIVVFNSNVLGRGEGGTSLADRDYFLWAKNQKQEGKYYVGKPVISRLGASEGEIIVPIASPVFQNGDLKGAVIAAVVLHDLTENYLELMKVSDMTKIYLVDEKGEILYSSGESDITNKSVYDLIDKNPSFVKINLGDLTKKAIETKEEGKVETSYLDSQTGKLMLHLVAYSPVVLENQSWLIIASTRVEDTQELIAPLYSRFKIVLTLIALTILFYGFFVARQIENKNQNNLSSSKRL